MGTMTAQFLAGQSHAYEGGIIPTHQIFLSENGRPALILSSLEQTVVEKLQLEKPIVWIPTLEYMADEALTLIMLHVLKDPDACAKAGALLGWNQESYLELYAYPEESRKQLYSFVKERYGEQNAHFKVTLNIFNGSSLFSRWKEVQTYPFEVEVTLPQFERSWNPFSRQIIIREREDQ